MKRDSSSLMAHQRVALGALGFMLTTIAWCAIIAWFVWMFVGCSRNNVGDETVNPAPSSGMTLTEAQSLGVQWAMADAANHRWSTPTPTSSMVPYMDSHSVLLLETVLGIVRLHDILVINEGLGRENICHQVTSLKDGFAFIEGKNNQYPDGWVPLAQAKWRVAGIIFSKG